MSLELTEIVSDLAKRNDSPFASVVYDSLCAELKSRDASLAILTSLLESKSFWEEITMYNLFACYFSKQQKNFSHSSKLKTTTFTGAEHSKKSTLGARKHSSISRSIPIEDAHARNSTKRFLASNHDQASEEINQAIEAVKAKDKSEQILNTVCKTLSEELPDEKFKEVILSSVESYYEKYYQELTSYCQKYIRQAYINLIIALTLISIGILVLLTGAIIIFVIGNLLGAIIITLGLICEIIGAWAFRLNIKSREKTSETIKELNTLTKFRAAKFFIDEITSTTKRDIALKKLVRNILEHERK